MPEISGYVFIFVQAQSYRSAACAPPPLPRAPDAAVAFGRLTAGRRRIFVEAQVSDPKKKEDLGALRLRRCGPFRTRFSRLKGDDLSHGDGPVIHSRIANES
jgi:hypothetical protein